MDGGIAITLPSKLIRNRLANLGCQIGVKLSYSPVKLSGQRERKEIKQKQLGFNKNHGQVKMRVLNGWL